MITRSNIWEIAIPRGNRVWGYPIYTAVEEQTASGLFLPQTSQKKVLQALEVIRVGKGVEDIQPGDTVILETNGGGEVVALDDDEGETHNIFVVHEKHCALIVPPKRTENGDT
jgi:co-chaperonin GroES (HSP10)